jgi:hypothetical protein
MFHQSHRKAYVGVSEPWLSTVSEVGFTSILGSDLLELLVDVLDDELGGVLDAEVGDKSNGELSLDGTWNDSLGSWCGYLSATRALPSR